MNEKEIIDYIKNNLRVEVSCYGTNIEVSLYLNGECISNDNDYIE